MRCLGSPLHTKLTLTHLSGFNVAFNCVQSILLAHAYYPSLHFRTIEGNLSTTSKPASPRFQRTKPGFAKTETQPLLLSYIFMIGARLRYGLHFDILCSRIACRVWMIDSSHKHCEDGNDTNYRAFEAECEG